MAGYVPATSIQLFAYPFVLSSIAVSTLGACNQRRNKFFLPGKGILPVSDLLDFRYFGRYRSPLFEYFPPLLPPFFQKGVELLKKGAIAPLLRKKGGTAPFLIPKCTDRVFLRYRYGIYREIPTEYRPKIPIRDTTLVNTYLIPARSVRSC